MALAKQQIQDIIVSYQRKSGDTGSSEVQIAILTARISYITEHLRKYGKDNHSRRGLLLLVSKRHKLLNYLKRDKEDVYFDLIKKLGIRK